MDLLQSGNHHVRNRTLSKFTDMSLVPKKLVTNGNLLITCTIHINIHMALKPTHLTPQQEQFHSASKSIKDSYNTQPSFTKTK